MTQGANPGGNQGAIGASNTHGPTPDQHDPRSGYILLVDDDRPLLDAVAELLHGEGFEVVTAASGGEALSAPVATPPALILLDSRLPNEQAQEVAAALRARDGWEAAHIVLFTAVDPNRAASIADEVGASGLITKPYNLDDLLALVGRYVTPLHPPTPL